MTCFRRGSKPSPLTEVGRLLSIFAGFCELGCVFQCGERRGIYEIDKEFRPHYPRPGASLCSQARLAAVGMYGDYH